MRCISSRKGLVCFYDVYAGAICFTRRDWKPGPSFTPLNSPMSTPSSADGLGPLGPLIAMMTQQIRPLLGLLVIYTIFGAMLIPLLVALLYFSPGKQRWTPMFSFVVFDVLLGLGIATWNAYWLVSLRYNRRLQIFMTMFSYLYSSTL
jgi:hypothetical protein